MNMDKTKMAVAVFDKRADQYQEKYMDVGLYTKSFDTFCSLISAKNAEILELACGPGNITKYLLGIRPDFKILATDLAPNMIELAAQNNPTAETQLLDCRDIRTLNKKYDAIMCGFCLPYLSKEEAIQLLHDASTVLKPGGVLYISTMEDDYSKSGMVGPSDGGPDRLFMHFHEADYLINALKNNHFQLVSLQRQEFPDQNETKTIDLIIIAQL